MKIAAGQIECAIGDVGANLQKMREFAERAKGAGAEWIVFPEMSDTGYVMSAIRGCARPWNEGAVPQLRNIAETLSLGIIAGVSEREGECIFNSQAVIDSAGQIVGKYRKTHLFSPAPTNEHLTCAAGEELVTLPLGEFRCGLGICYDLRFPEFHRALATEHNADLFAVSAAWPFPRIEHLRALAIARAIENQSYLVLANRVGRDGGGVLCGTSCIIDPYGLVIAAASPHEEQLLVADLSFDYLRSIRETIRVFEHRRPELYRTRQD
ncbi:MAG: nitrilase-related carbon-nitrogen hydrolase [Chthoniobacterales bacterium]